jgi:hypothetical protein
MGFPGYKLRINVAIPGILGLFASLLLFSVINRLF